MATLRLVPASGTPHELKGDALVGREPGCDVVVADGSVSRKHARLELRPAGWTVVDQGSANGTFLDSQRVAEATLQDGQELRFGAVGFKVELEDDLAATMVATPSPDATVVAPAHLMPTPPLGIPSAMPLGPQLDPPAPPLARPAAVAPPKAGPPPLARPPAPAPPPPLAPSPPLPAPPRVSPPSAAPPLPAAPSTAASRDRFATRPVAGASGPAPVGQMAPPAATEKKGRGPIVWIIAGCCGCLLLGLLAAAGIGGAAFFATQAPASAVQSHLAELRRGDLDAAYGRLSPELQAQLPREAFEQLVKDHPGLGQNKDATFWNRSVNNDGARLTGVLTATSGDVEPATFELVKQGSDWRITDIRVGAEAQ